MVKKVTLDTLDIEDSVLSPQETLVATDDGTEKQIKQGFMSRRLYLLSGVIMVLLAAGGLSYWLHEMKDNASSTSRGSQDRSSKASVNSMRSPTVALLNDFVIPVTDDLREERALVCDVAVELNGMQYQENIKKNIIDVRNVIFDAIKKRTVTTLLRSEGRVAVKEEIMIELVKYLGKDCVKRIYFTEFMVL